VIMPHAQPDCHIGIKEYDLHRNVTDPISGGVMAALWTITEFTSGIAKIFYKPVEGIIMTTVAIPQSLSLARLGCLGCQYLI
jgi:hypothetical protein